MNRLQTLNFLDSAGRLSLAHSAGWTTLAAYLWSPSLASVVAVAIALAAAAFERRAEWNERKENAEVDAKIAAALSTYIEKHAELESKVSALSLQFGMKKG